jgi:hypothetical protein
LDAFKATRLFRADSVRDRPSGPVEAAENGSQIARLVAESEHYNESDRRS